jgi:hypothetical protein
MDIQYVYVPSIKLSQGVHRDSQRYRVKLEFDVFSNGAEIRHSLMQEM